MKIVVGILGGTLGERLDLIAFGTRCSLHAARGHAANVALDVPEGATALVLNADHWPYYDGAGDSLAGLTPIQRARELALDVSNAGASVAVEEMTAEMAAALIAERYPEHGPHLAERIQAAAQHFTDQVNASGVQQLDTSVEDAGQASAAAAAGIEAAAAALASDVSRAAIGGLSKEDSRAKELEIAITEHGQLLHAGELLLREAAEKIRSHFPEAPADLEAQLEAAAKSHTLLGKVEHGIGAALDALTGKGKA